MRRPPALEDGPKEILAKDQKEPGTSAGGATGTDQQRWANMKVPVPQVL